MRRVFTLLDEMKDKGVEPSDVTYACATLRALGPTSDSPLRLRSGGCVLPMHSPPSLCRLPVRSYIYVLRACLLLKDADRAFAIYERAYDEGVVLNDVCHNLLIKVAPPPGPRLAPSGLPPPLRRALRPM